MHAVTAIPHRHADMLTYLQKQTTLDADDSMFRPTHKSKKCYTSTAMAPHSWCKAIATKHVHRGYVNCRLKPNAASAANDMLAVLGWIDWAGWTCAVTASGM